MGPPKIWKNKDFSKNLNRPFWAFLGLSGPRDPENRTPRALFSILVVSGIFSTHMGPFPGPFWFLAPGKHVPQTHPEGAPGAPWEAPRAAPRPPGPSRTPPGAIRKVVPENAKNSVLGAPGNLLLPIVCMDFIIMSPGAPPTLFFASSGTTFRIAPGGVREGPGGPGAGRGASHGAPGPPFGRVLGMFFSGCKNQKWPGNGPNQVQKIPKTFTRQKKAWGIRCRGPRGPERAKKGPKWPI